MDERTEQFLMRPGDTFVARECGCSFTVTSGPSDESMVSQAPTCCCGHPMVKQTGANQNNQSMTGMSVDDTSSNGAPQAMAD